MAFRGPLASSYGGAVALVVLALTPYLVLTTAELPLSSLIQSDVGLGGTAIQVTSGMANAAYAVGAVIAAQLAARLPARRMLVVYAVLFVVGSVLAAWAPVPGFHVAGRVLQGLSTGLMLIAAVPPLIIGWPQSKLPITATIMNLGLFGAVALGPVVGGASASTGTWRPLFWIVAGLGALTVVMALLTYEDDPPAHPDAPLDVTALVLAAGGCAAAFFGASYLTGHRFVSLPVLVPLGAGVLMLLALIVHQARSRDALMPVGRMLARLYPVLGIVVAMVAGAVSVSLVQVVQTGWEERATPVHLGMLFWPEFGAAVVTAVLFGFLLRTRWLMVLVLAGLVGLAGAAALLTGAARGSSALVVVGSGLVGFGAAASVAPALFLSGLSLQSTLLPRIFALVELLRGVAAFLVGPLLLHLAQTTGAAPATGLRTATWILFALATAGVLLVVTLFLLGRGRLQTPDIEPWLEGEEPALGSPAISGVLQPDAPPAGAWEDDGEGTPRKPEPRRDEGPARDGDRAAVGAA